MDSELWWTPEGWTGGTMMTADGRFGGIVPGDDGGSPRLPAMTDAHSHAFQRALAGRAEYRQSGQDDFWSWRELMYRSLDRIDPDLMLAIATELYVELVRQGYARVCEFHYVHNAPDGRPYADRTVMADALVEAARVAGIGLTLLPVLYTSSGFGGAAPTRGQRRFVQSVDDYLRMVADLEACAGAGGYAVGTALHSLRAVTPQDMSLVLDARRHGPVHIHAAEQVGEVDACLRHTGMRPVEWLLAHADIGPRWTVVHATHMTDEEAAALARSGATVALCPTTEASLGDGFFNADAFLGAGGRFAIGSDSNVCSDPCEELRLLEYGRRLRARRRVLGIDRDMANAGAWAWRNASAAGAHVSGMATGTIEAGARADFVVLDTDHPTLAGLSGDTLVDALVFGGGDGAIRETWVEGKRITADGRHPREETTRAAYRRAMIKLREGNR